MEEEAPPYEQCANCSFEVLNAMSHIIRNIPDNTRGAVSKALYSI